MTKSDNNIKLSDVEPLDDPIFWVDIETTGLDPTKDEVIQVAIIVTNGLWDVVDNYKKAFPLTNKGIERLANNEYVYNMHEKTGLLDELEEARKQGAHDFKGKGHESLECFLLSALDKFEGDAKPMWAGSSVHFDKTFLESTLSAKVSSKFSHRIVDASALREVARREDGWRLDLLEKVKDKEAKHKADYDILHSMHTLAVCYGYSLGFFDNLPNSWDEVTSMVQARDVYQDE